MILPDDKKRIATIIASRKSAKGEDLGAAPMQKEVVKDAAGEIDGRHLASQEMIAAFHEKSPEQLMRAMANFMDLHSSLPKAEPQD